MKLSIEGDNFLKISKSKSTSNPFVTLTVGRITNPIAVVVGWDSIFGDDKLSSSLIQLGMLVFIQ